MKRLLRVLAVLFLVPVVVFSNAQTAGAATSGMWTFTLDGGPLFEDARCQVPWAKTSTGVTIGASSRCDAGSEVSPGFCQPFEGTCGMYAIVLKSSTGVTCGSAPFEGYDPPGNDLGSVAGGLGSAFVAVAGTSCVPATACLSYYFEPPGPNLEGDNLDSVHCVNAGVDPFGPSDGGTLPPPSELPFGMCEWGTPMGVGTAHLTVATPNVKDMVRLLFSTRYPEMYPVGTVGNSAREWEMRIAHNVEGSTTPIIRFVQTDDTTNGNGPMWQSDTLWINQPSGVAGSHSGSADGPAWGIQVTTRHTATKGQFAGTPGQIGYTNPGKCSFWFGPKIRATDDPNFGMAKPAGPLTDISSVTPAPTPTPPTTVTPTNVVPENESGFWGAILAVLRSIWNAIGSIVGGIKNALKALFIPDTDKWGVADLRDTMRDKPPMSAVVELKDQTWDFIGAYTSSGWCSSIAEFEVVPGQGSSIDCTAISQAPGMSFVYSMVAGGLIAITAWVAFGWIQQVFQAGQ